MKFLFVAPRFHTNSINWVKALKKKSHQVNYAVITIIVFRLSFHHLPKSPSTSLSDIKIEVDDTDLK